MKKHNLSKNKLKLFVVSTPIGNLKDITLRAIEKLKESSLIIAEDTRIAKNLFSSLDIETREKKFISYFKGKENIKLDKIYSSIKKRKKASLVTSAGTPSISDPGYSIVNHLKKRGVEIITIPGPSAVTACLPISGLASDKFLFLGFISKSEYKTKRLFSKVSLLPYTIIFFDSPNRISRTLSILKEILPERKITICRELTKKYEQLIEGNVENLEQMLKKQNIKGEITVVIEKNFDSSKMPKTFKDIENFLVSSTTLSLKKIRKILSNKR